jgi:hypothetical protein
MIVSVLSQLIDIKEIINQTKLTSLIWNDPRFVETWFNFEMTTEQILDFYSSWGISTKIIANSYNFFQIYTGTTTLFKLFIEKFSLTNIDTEEHLKFSMPLTI